MRPSLAACVFALAFALPSVQAQAPTGAASLPFSLNEADFGAAGDVQDNCVLVDTGLAAGDGAQNFDLRMTDCLGHPTGSEIGDEDVQERSTAYPQVGGPGAETVVYADADDNGRYAPGDYVYARSTPGSGLLASTGTGTWTVRLTATPGHAAGTFVFAGDDDLEAFAQNAPAWPAASVAWKDNDGSKDYSPGDVAYLIPRAPGFPAGSLIPLGSVRLTSALVSSSSTQTASPA